MSSQKSQSPAAYIARCAATRAIHRGVVLASVLASLYGCSSDHVTGPNDSFTVTPANAIALGAKFSCGLAVNGTAYCWGVDNLNQLGTTAKLSSFSPTLVSTALTFAAIASTDNAVCGLRGGGSVYCWGLVPGSTTTASGGVAVPQLQQTPVLSSIVVGYEFACGLNASGAAFCWGINTRGQLGVGDTLARSAATAVAGGQTFTSISAGFWHACGVTATGTVYCWGDDQFGELGVSPRVSYSATPTLAPTSVAFQSVAAGSTQTCALTAAGAAYCWGSNIVGQLGDGTTVEHDSPQPVATSVAFSSLRISHGNDIHGFACGVTAGSTVYCWGTDESQQIGSAAASNCGAALSACVLIPTLQPGLTNVSAINVGDSHTCALIRGGSTAMCWGANADGELGDGTTTPRGTPLLVTGGVRFP